MIASGIIELIVKLVGEAIALGRDPVKHVRERLQAHPAIPDESIDDLDNILKEIADDLPASDR